MNLHIVKRKGHKEKFDGKKLYASVYSACLASHLKEKDAEDIAGSVTREVKQHISKEKQVTSDHIFRVAVKALAKKNKEAAFMYETHMDVS